METLTEVNVSAAIAAEAGQWRWAWRTDAVLTRLRLMRADLKRAFAADATPPAIESVTVSQCGCNAGSFRARLGSERAQQNH